MVLIEFAMNPPDRGQGLAPYVARILDVIDRSGLNYQLTPMGTILEGGYDEVMKVVGDCFRVLEKDCPRIGMNLKMDYRAGTESRLKSKVEAVEQQLGRKLKT
ncbi:MTH1187 family thiamine-binding protein [Ramlibacter humi]|uniref:MTH1187 family thiamine-binding protein n=1 Tax=Ramlibacter humi TaxID=2530451 RepID=A0A4Z0CBB6_9BURK|nr:MTH1187 family thiamine-binding protein [Ramlibacter humi]TFZ08893.1 MTH1187 family thiamine-binding protein [Ramlibacter humi]